MVLWQLRFFVTFQGSKLTHTNLQNVSDFDNLQARTKSTSKPLRVRIIHVSQTFGESCSNSHQFASGKILLTKLCKWTKKLTLSPDLYTDEYRGTFFELTSLMNMNTLSTWSLSEKCTCIQVVSLQFMALESQYKLISFSALHHAKISDTVKIPNKSFGVTRIIVNSVLFCTYMLYMYNCLENRNFQLGGVIFGWWANKAFDFNCQWRLYICSQW